MIYFIIKNQLSYCNYLVKLLFFLERFIFIENPAHFLLYKLSLLRLNGPSFMRKTNKSVAKRFKVTAKGKVLFRKPGKRHLMRRKSTNQKRSMGQDQVLGDGMARRFKRALPFN